MFYLNLQAILLVFGCGSCLPTNPIDSILEPRTRPYFDPLTSINISAPFDGRAVLPCTIRDLGDKTVSWLRTRDAHILTVGIFTFIGDDRFMSHFSNETWNLVIKYVRASDAGLYECQVSTEPKITKLFTLRVFVPRISINLLGDQYMKAGSKFMAECRITGYEQPPDHIIWYHNDDRIMDHTDSNTQIYETRDSPGIITSTLTIHGAQKEDSGKYTCAPSNLPSAEVMLYVLIEEYEGNVSNGNTGANKMVNYKIQVLLFLEVIFGVAAIVWVYIRG